MMRWFWVAVSIAPDVNSDLTIATVPSSFKKTFQRKPFKLDGS